jgi:hypothetical protein
MPCRINTAEHVGEFSYVTTPIRITGCSLTLLVLIGLPIPDKRGVIGMWEFGRSGSQATFRKDLGFCTQEERYLRAVSAGSTPTNENMHVIYNDKLTRRYVQFRGTLCQ